MPGMDGQQLVVELAALLPDTRALFMSGYTDDAALRNGLLHQTAAFLQKPFTPEGFARKVRSVLDETPVSG